MGGGLVGEAWGKSKEPVEIPINNYQDRPTYYGALNLLESNLILEKYSTGNGENTVKFVENLQKKMALLNYGMICAKIREGTRK
jgi:hypothetical protein